MPHWLRVCWLRSACSHQRWVCNFPSPTTSTPEYNWIVLFYPLNRIWYVIYDPLDKEVVWFPDKKSKSVVHLPPSQRCTVQCRAEWLTSPLHTIKAVPLTTALPLTSHHQSPTPPPPSQRTASQQVPKMLEEKTSLLSLTATGDHCCYVVSSALCQSGWTFNLKKFLNYTELVSHLM